MSKNITIGLLIFIAALLGGAKAYIDYQIQYKLNTLNQSAIKNIQLNYDDARLSWKGDIVIQNMQLTMENLPNITIEKLILHQAYLFYDIKKRLPTRSHLALFNVQMDVPDISSQAPNILFSYKPYYLSLHELRQSGFTQFKMNVDILIKQTTDNLTISLNIQGQHWANIDITANLLNVPLLLVEWSEQAKLIQLEQFVINYEEQNLMKKLTTFTAHRNNQVENIFKQQLAYKIRHDIETLNIPLQTSSIDSLTQFIQQPERLQLILQPKPPLPTYQSIINTLSMDVIQRLGLEIKSAKK